MDDTAVLPTEVTERLSEGAVAILAEMAKPADGCHQCSGCCRYVLLGSPPSELERDYGEWLNLRDSRLTNGGLAGVQDIWVIWPMLAGRCRGKWKHPAQGHFRYVYGPCKHLTLESAEDDARWVCSLYAFRPHMCEHYPRYRYSRQILMGSEACGGENPSYIKGCGFNSDPNDGFGDADFKELVPLEDHEKSRWELGHDTHTQRPTDAAL